MTKKNSNNSRYSQTKAIFALALASFRSILRSPSAVVFTLAFPLVFILVFGFIGNGNIKINVATTEATDMNNPIFKALSSSEVVHLISSMDEDERKSALEKGQLDAIVEIERNTQSHAPAFFINVTTSRASLEKGNIFKSVVNTILYNVNFKARNITPPIAELKETLIEGREFKTIDFILPGQLGFSLLSTGVFGTAFVFISLRLTLVIKRFFATPVRRSSIVLGEALSRMVFALLGALFIILIGHFFFGFTLLHGFRTVMEMLILSALGLTVFMGFGFAVSGIAKNESSVPPIANIITLPQFLLSGTFFSIDLFPNWLQPISRILPLTYLNDAFRKVAFEGASLWDVNQQILVLVIWGIIIYSLAVKVFKWE